MKHFLRPAALFCTALCCLALAGCRAPMPGAQPQSTATPAAQQSSLTWLAAGVPCAVNEAGYYNILVPNNGALRLLSLYDFSAKQHRILCDKEGCPHTDESCGAYLPALSLTAGPGAVYAMCPRYLTDAADESGLADFVAMDENGQNRHTLSTISDNWTFTGADEQYLYGFCEDAFGRISLSDGTETYLLRNAREKFLFWGKIAGVWDGQFVTV